MLASDDDPVGSLASISPEDLQAVASSLASLASSSIFDGLEGEVGAEEVDPEFIKKALKTLSSVISSSAQTGDLLSSLQESPEEAVQGAAAVVETEVDDETVQAVLMYSSSLMHVLSSNEFLRRRVNELIQAHAKDLAANRNFSKVLMDISRSSVFEDLKEEVEEDLQNRSGIFIQPEDDGDLSR